ncbi:MAG: chorismate mutase [Ilumatobacteraceae bacterium]|jgi:chorismate mutase-like protein|nr:chorismate mutase [Ilumatobacteraceae bacterium]MBJ7486933.1 chorismate mutase [Ilumatobacteraceae bacterium]
MASLDNLRSEIDDIDHAIIDLLARRLRICADVARIKAETGSTVIQPARVRDVLSTRRQWAIDQGVDADFAEHLFRTLLAETHRIEVADSRAEPAPLKNADAVVRSELDTVACRIDHVVVAVVDLIAAQKFFSDMGFRIQQTDDINIVSAEAGGVAVVLVGPGDDPAVAAQLSAHGSGVQHIAIEVLNAGFTRDALDAAGVPRLTDVIVDSDGHEQVFTVLDPATGVQLGFISRTGHRVPMNSHNVRAMFSALSGDA